MLQILFCSDVLVVIQMLYTYKPYLILEIKGKDTLSIILATKIFTN